MRQSRFILLTWFATIVYSNLLAQPLSLKTYTLQDGLVANRIRHIFQDSKGFIWIATWEGLSKYDGHRFTNYTRENGLSHNLVNDFYETPDGRLLVAENNGSVDIIMPDGSTQKNYLHDIVFNRFFKTSTGKVLLPSDDRGIYEWQNGKCQLLQRSSGGFVSTAELDDSTFIFANPLQVFNYRQKTFSPIAMHDSVTILSLCLDSRKRLWIGTQEGMQMALRDKNTGGIKTFALPDSLALFGLRHNTINDILEDADKNLWMATHNGLIKMAPDGSLSRYSERDGLPSDMVTSVFQDKERNIWIGTYQGLTKLATKINVSTYKTEQDIFDIVPVQNKMLVFSNKDCKAFDIVSNRFTAVRMDEKFLRNNLLFPMGTVALQVKAGLADYDAAIDKISHLGYFGMDEYPRGAIDRSGNIFFLSDNLKIFSHGRAFADSTVPYRKEILLIDKRGYLWIGTWKEGLYRMQYSIAGNRFNSSVTNFSMLVPGKHIRSLFQDSHGNIWVGTRYDGVFKLSEKAGGDYSVQHFQKSDGLLSEWITCFAEDEEGNIWIGSSSGLNKSISRNNKTVFVDISHLYNFFGSVISIVTAHSGQVWCAINGHLIHFSDNQLEAMPPMPVYITAASLGSTTSQVNALQSAAVIALPHNENQAHFEYSAAGFINEKEVRYSYRLKGSDDTAWTAPANTHTVSYASLQPGKYRFEVRSIGWNQQPGNITAFSFIIRPPWWKTWWFTGFCVVMLGSIGYFIYRYRINQIIKLQKVRNSIATDLHDEIGTSLTNIAILSELIYKNTGQPENFAQRISEEVSNSGQALDDIVWSINTQNDTLEQTVARMRRYTAEVLETSGISYALEMDEKFSGTRLSMEQRRDFFLLFKECVNNIYKHAQARKVQIHIAVEKNNLHLSVADDGKGFDVKSLTHRNGLKNMEHRTQKWKGRIQIDSLIGGGTVTRIYLPIQP